MAVDRLPPIAPRLPQVQPSPGARAAQKAFFQAALNQVQGVAAPAATPVAAPPAPVQKSESATASTEPRAGYKPGSLLNIRV